MFLLRKRRIRDVGAVGNQWRTELPAAALIYSAIQTASSAKAFQIRRRDDVTNDGDETEERCCVFHVVMVLERGHMTAVVCGWSLVDTSSVTSIDQGWASTWVEVGAVWITSLVYGWSLIAPLLLCLNREFD
jgi:hypothetical protein